MSVYRRLLRFIRPHTLHLVGAILTNIAAAVLDAFSIALLIPFLNALFDRPPLDLKAGWISHLLYATVGRLMVAGDKFASLRNVIGVVMMVVILKNVFVWLSGQLGVSLQEYVTRDLRNAVYRHLERLPLSYFTRTKAGQILSRVINDTSEARLILTQIVTQALQASALVLASVAFLFGISWQLTLIALVLVPILALIFQPILKKLRRGNRRRGTQHGEMTSVLQETVSGIRLVKSFGAETYEEQRFVAASNIYARSSARLSQLTFLAQPITEVFGTMMALTLLWIGAREVFGGHALAGADLITFLIYVLRLLQPLKQLTSVPASAQSSLASAERLFDVLDTPAEYETDRGTVQVTGFKRDLVFEQVGFSYEIANARQSEQSVRPDGAGALPNALQDAMLHEPPRMVLQDVSFRATRGNIVALVGSSGAGKTTLVDLIPRFYEATEGRILLDGVDTQTITLASLRSMIGVVSQDTVLFYDTVRNNIAYGAGDRYTDEQIEAAARAANAHGFISALPDGYHTVLGERGTRLSGGQRQRIAIARALLLDPPILILDEATSALDTESERLVQAAIDRLLQGRTVFVIAHRLSTVQHATQILVLDRGKIVERGTHAELLAMQGTYARLHALQFRHVQESATAPLVPSPSAV